uniref:uncharacterized protein LOC122597757 n=1 Tax=Erigeron canadensis TaxID=72917 RepID=UPI001CB8EE09|nr:uncharacterized protein LOC122597757 [Erigeron canadensis]
MSDKKEDFVPTEQTDKKEKKKRKKWRVKQNGRWFKIDKNCIKEAGLFRTFYRSPSFENRNLNISKTDILKLALRFCKERGKIKTIYAHDQNLLQSKCKEYDSGFLKYMKDNHRDDDLIDLIDAACKLQIDSLFDLLFEEVAVIIFNRKTLEEVEKIFEIRNRNDADDILITMIMNGARWPLETMPAS